MIQMRKRRNGLLINKQQIKPYNSSTGFSTFGMITLSEASVPKLSSGEWIIAVVMDDR